MKKLSHYATFVVMHTLISIFFLMFMGNLNYSYCKKEVYFRKTSDNPEKYESYQEIYLRYGFPEPKSLDELSDYNDGSYRPNEIIKIQALFY